MVINFKGKNYSITKNIFNISLGLEINSNNISDASLYGVKVFNN